MRPVRKRKWRGVRRGGGGRREEVGSGEGGGRGEGRGGGEGGEEGEGRAVSTHSVICVVQSHSHCVRMGCVFCLVKEVATGMVAMKREAGGQSKQILLYGGRALLSNSCHFEPYAKRLSPMNWVEQVWPIDRWPKPSDGLFLSREISIPPVTGAQREPDCKRAQGAHEPPGDRSGGGGGGGGGSASYLGSNPSATFTPWECGFGNVAMKFNVEGSNTLQNMMNNKIKMVSNQTRSLFKWDDDSAQKAVTVVKMAIFSRKPGRTIPWKLEKTRVFLINWGVPRSVLLAADHPIHALAKRTLRSSKKNTKRSL